VARLLDDNDIAALLGEQGSDGRAGGTAADDQDVTTKSRLGHSRLGR
jgi:hypothetical protein